MNKLSDYVYVLSSVTILKDKETNRSRGFGFITLYNPDNVAMAIEECNGMVSSIKIGNSGFWLAALAASAVQFCFELQICETGLRTSFEEHLATTLNSMSKLVPI